MNPPFAPVSWSAQSNLYEVNLRQYTEEGSFRAFASALPRLRDMGVEILWFMPITPIGKLKRQGSLGSYYASSSFVQVNPEFGTLEDFRWLVRRCHDEGFRVLIDWVANHTAWDHEWTQSHPEYYKRNAAGEFYDNNGWVDVIDLNYYDHAMRRAMIESMAFWVDVADIDGFRCDMAHLVPLDFWREARQALDARKPLFWLAETEHPMYRLVFDASYAWHWMHLTRRLFAEETGFDELVGMLQDQLREQSMHRLLYFTSNHDENSWNGTEFEKYGAAAPAFAVFSCTWAGLPLIYSGQEIPNRRRLAFFEKDALDWSHPPALHDFYKRLLGLRRWLGRGPWTTSIHTGKMSRHILAYRHAAESREALVLLNLSGQAQQADLDLPLATGSFVDLFSGEKKQTPSICNLPMGPWSYAVFRSL